MADLTHNFTIPGPFPDSDPIDTLILFYRTNGYSLVERTEGEQPEGLRVIEASPDAPAEDHAESTNDDDEGAEAEGPEESSESDDDPERRDEDAEESDIDEESEESQDSDDDPERQDEDAEESDIDEESEESQESDAGEEGERSPEPGPGEDSEESGASEDSEEGAAAVVLKATLQRGKAGAGWLSSNMTELLTDLELTLEADQVAIAYVVDVSGQRLQEEEREFWRREYKAARRFLMDDGPMDDVREGERERARELRRDYIMTGVWGAVVVALVLFFGIVAFLSGWH